MGNRFGVEVTVSVKDPWQTRDRLLTLGPSVLRRSGLVYTSVLDSSESTFSTGTTTEGRGPAWARPEARLSAQSRREAHDVRSRGPTSPPAPQVLAGKDPDSGSRRTGGGGGRNQSQVLGNYFVRVR